MSPRTIRAYADDAALFATCPTHKGMPTAAASIRREHIEAFIDAELEHTAPSSAATRYRSLQQFFRWLDDEGEISGSPMADVPPGESTQERAERRRGADPAEHRCHRAVLQQIHVIDRIGASGHPGGQARDPQPRIRALVPVRADVRLGEIVQPSALDDGRQRIRPRGALSDGFMTAQATLIIPVQKVFFVLFSQETQRIPQWIQA
jgi:Phage integrase, N-terminal SAM-like domain